MSDRVLVSTRKGLFTIARRAGRWEIGGVDFLGDNVALTLTDRRDGCTYAALDHGHFGVKLHRSDDRGATWTEIAAPTYPPQPADEPEKPKWSTSLVWALAPALDCLGEFALRQIDIARRFKDHAETALVR